MNTEVRTRKRLDRALITGILAMVLVIIMGLLRPDDIDGLYEEHFWGLKARRQQCAEIVVAGDSRVGAAISPAEMERYLDGLEVYNYGFNAMGYSAEYMDHLPSLLDPDGDRRVIVLGISPRSLSRDAAAQNLFTVYRRQKPTDYFFASRLGELLRFCEPMSFGHVMDGLFSRGESSRCVMSYYKDGWLASDQVPPRPTKKLDNYIREFDRNPTVPELINGVIEYVRRWREEGIEVFAFRIPTCEQMVAIEDAASGFDESAFVSVFEDAGGRWIELDQAAYETYDGSHLRAAAAVACSRDLAKELLGRLR